MNPSSERPSNRRFVRNCEYSNRPGGAGAQSEYLTSCRLTSHARHQHTRQCSGGGSGTKRKPRNGLILFKSIISPAALSFAMTESELRTHVMATASAHFNPPNHIIAGVLTAKLPHSRAASSANLLQRYSRIAYWSSLLDAVFATTFIDTIYQIPTLLKKVLVIFWLAEACRLHYTVYNIAIVANTPEMPPLSLLCYNQ